MSEFVDCRTCKTDCVRANGNYGYTFCDKYTHPPMTKADRIRAMSDEELANWLARTQYANMMEAAEIFGAKLPFKEETLKDSEKECLEWLQQPCGGGQA